MSTPSYLVPGLVLSPSPTFSSQTMDLQGDLRSLGYHSGPIDGIFGSGTTKAIMALQFDLQNNSGSSTAKPGDGSAPVAVQNYNNGAVTSQTGILDQPLASCIAAMLTDSAFPKVPSSTDPSGDNQAALAAIAAISPPQVPIPFLMQVFIQESGQQHFQVPSTNNTDNFVTIGLGNLCTSLQPASFLNKL